MTSANEQVRPAQVGDARAICSLINDYAETGKMLHRSLQSIYEDLREFLVAADGDGQVIGCVATDIYWADLGEIRSLAVKTENRGLGVGGELVQAAIQDARKLGITRLFTLTYEKDFFARQGFEVIDRQALPEKIWQICINCPRFENCDETAMMLKL